MLRQRRRRRSGRRDAIGVFVIVGPSGVGKSTLVNRLRQWRPDLFWSVSVTTRERRPNETDGIDYHFVSDAEFDAMVAAGDLLEWAEIYGHRSGTPRRPVEEALTTGRDVLLEVDVQGGRSVKRTMPAAEVVFVMPPSIEVLRERLAKRRTEDGTALQRRLARAEAEMAAAHEFDHEVVNDDAETAWRAIADIISRSGTTPVRGNARS